MVGFIFLYIKKIYQNIHIWQFMENLVTEENVSFHSVTKKMSLIIFSWHSNDYQDHICRKIPGNWSISIILKH